MAGWQKRLSQLAARLDGEYEARRAQLGFGPDRPLRIDAYRGYGRADSGWFRARVLRGAPPPRSREGDSVWLNLAASLQRFESDEVPGAKVRVRFPGGETVLTADREGYVECRLRPQPAWPAAGGWQTVSLELLEPAGGYRCEAPILVPPAEARFGVISDLDDTVIRSDVTSRLRLMRNVFLGNAHTRLPFPGVAAFYRALSRGTGTHPGMNPIFYVSSSPWNLYDVLADLLELRAIPLGPLLLRDWGIEPAEPGHGHSGHKSRHIREILEAFPTLPFILVGDSGQEDPEIYHRAVHDHPRRILAVYIRNVSRNPMRDASIRALAAEVERAGSTLLLADDTLAAARHAAGAGWIDPAALEEIGAVAREDERAPAPPAAPRPPAPPG